MLADYEALIRRGVVYVLADEGISGVLVMEQVGEAVFVENVAVLPSNQRSGLGRRLMRFAEEFARERGLSEILLYTNERMTENIAFYKGLGFREVDRRLEDGYRRVYLNKNLSEDA